ncbi:hypothetical protein [Thalassolituus oleivorans]|uniref:hypothetical protein n=1 Tax=Thalassolituus oleivorans TaxID=187493 RepID=UPI0023F18C49|nr:hypothetical protein [Thalassolituus oleivorans]
MQLNHQLVNTHYIDRIGNVAYAIGKLTDLDISILDIDMNRAKPVITVQRCYAVHQLNGVQFARKGGPAGPINRMQANIHNCRIEWEVQP